MENIEHQNFSPIAKFNQARHQQLEEVEGKHDAEPGISVTSIAIGFSLIEAVVAFYLLLSAGLLVASIGAMFPVFLVWGMANYQSENSEFSKKLRQLLNQYQDTETVTPITSDSNFSIPLIPDHRDLQEQIIDEVITWVSNDNPNSPHKTPEMVEYWAEKDYFIKRKEELKRERQEIIHQHWLQYQSEASRIEEITYRASQNQISNIGPKHQQKLRKQEYVKLEIGKLQQKRKQNMQLIANRFNTLIQQCDERINQAQANYEQAYDSWLKGRD